MDDVTVTPYVENSGKWHVRIRVKGIKKRPRPSLGVPGDQDHTEALELFTRDVLPSIVAELRAGAEAAKATEAELRKGGPTLRSLAEWYTRTHLPYLGRAPKTIDHYERTLADFITYCSGRHVGRAAQLSGRIVQEWQNHVSKIKGRDSVSRDQVSAVKHWLECCHEAGELDELPPVKWQVPPKAKSKRFKSYPRETIAAWLDGLKAWRPNAARVVEWVDLTGWRIGDVLDLRIGEVDRDAGVIERDQLKTSNSLSYPINERMEKLLDAALHGRKSPQSDEHVFLDTKGAPWDYHRIQKVLKFYQDSKRWEGEAITFRDLRKSFASHLAMGGCPPNVLKELMGHQDIAMTLEFYVDVDFSTMLKWSKWHTANH